MRTPKHWTTDHREWYRTVYLASDHWRELKARKLSLNPTCEKCGFFRHLDVHHVDYKQLFDVQPSDLMTLCRRCHEREHAEKGMPVRNKISYENYIPKHASEKLEQQKLAAKQRSVNRQCDEADGSARKQAMKSHRKKWRTCSKEQWNKTRI